MISVSYASLAYHHTLNLVLITFFFFLLFFSFFCYFSSDNVNG